MKIDRVKQCDFPLAQQSVADGGDGDKVIVLDHANQIVCDGRKFAEADLLTDGNEACCDFGGTFEIAAEQREFQAAEPVGHLERGAFHHIAAGFQPECGL